MPKDHIALPKTTLKNFADKSSGKIYYLDLSTKKICSAYAKTFNTCENYYPTDKEQFLSSEIETVLGRLNKELDKLQNGANEVHLSSNIREVVIKCLAIQVLRIPDFSRTLHQESQFKNIIPAEFFSPLHRKGYYYIEVACSLLNKLLSNYDINAYIIDPSNSYSFILPTSHSLSNGRNMILVLSPHRSIILLPKSSNQKYYTNDGYLSYLEAKKYSDLEFIFSRTIKDEKKLYNGRIVGLKPQLEKIKNLL